MLFLNAENLPSVYAAGLQSCLWGSAPGLASMPPLETFVLSATEPVLVLTSSGDKHLRDHTYTAASPHQVSGANVSLLRLEEPSPLPPRAQ